MTKIAETRTNLAQRKCKPCEGGMKPMEANDVTKYLQQLNGWEYSDGVIYRVFEFKNYDETVAFVNAVAWIARKEDHHPDISFGYKKCRVSFMTHAVEGLSENDFIAAAKVDCLTEM